MIAIGTFLTSRLGIGLIAGLALVAMWIAWGVNVNSIRAEHAFQITAQMKETARVQKEWDDYKLQVQQGATKQAEITAEENRLALAHERELQAEIDRLRAANAVATRQRNEASQKLLAVLNNAPQVSASPLDPASVEFYRGLRESQLGAMP